MLTVLHVALVLFGSPPGPLDAYRANVASTRAGANFTYTAGTVDASALPEPGGPPFRGVAFAEEPRRTITGRWETDGQVERYECGTPEAVAGPVLQKLRPGDFTSIVSRFELLYDGEIAAYHYLGNDTLEVARSNDGVLLTSARGPARWWSEVPFPALLKKRFPDVTPERFNAEVGGRPVEVEVYRRPQDNGSWDRLEIAYDPGAGYLPRFARRLFFDAATGQAYVSVMYLTEEWPSRRGGVVATEWFEFLYDIDRFQNASPRYEPFERLEPSRSRIAVGRYQASEVADLDAPVALTTLERIRRVACVGGSVALSKPPRTLTLTQAVRMLGPRFDRPSPPSLATLDTEEMAKYQNVKPRTGYGPYLGLVCGIALLAFVVWRRGWRRAAPLALLAVLAGGCGGPAASPDAGQPVVRLTARFETPRIIIEDRASAVQTRLNVANAGSSGVTLFAADGGCSCRKIDERAFPFTLGPGETRTLEVSLFDKGDYDPKHVNLTFQTNVGNLICPAPVHLIPRHRISPDSISVHALEGEGSPAFDLVHREVIPVGSHSTHVRLIAPAEFDARLVREEQVKSSEKLHAEYVERTFRVACESEDFGLRSGQFRLVDASGRDLLQIPATWQRTPYLSSLPERVVLGAAQVRVFLRCPDESVEFTEIKRAPSGVKAILVSPREIAVTLDSSPPLVIDQPLEVITSAVGRPPLRIPIVRYGGPKSAGDRAMFGPSPRSLARLPGE